MNYFQVLTLALQAAAEIEQIKPLHNEERFNAIKTDAVQTLQLATATFFPTDKLAQAIVSAAVAAISTLKYEDVVNPKPAPVEVPATPDVPAATTPKA